MQEVRRQLGGSGRSISCRMASAPTSGLTRHRQPGFGGGRGSRLAAGRTPLAGAGAPAASGSRSWCRRHGGRAQRWSPPLGGRPARRRAAPRTAPAALRSADPALGRAKCPPRQDIERMFEIESGMLLTATGWTSGAHRGTGQVESLSALGMRRAAHKLGRTGSDPRRTTGAAAATSTADGSRLPMPSQSGRRR